jgi:hypothetical protein
MNGIELLSTRSHNNTVEGEFMVTYAKAQRDMCKRGVMPLLVIHRAEPERALWDFE